MLEKKEGETLVCEKCGFTHRLTYNHDADVTPALLVCPKCDGIMHIKKEDDVEDKNTGDIRNAGKV